MDKSTFIEAMSMVVLAVLMDIAGHYFNVPELGTYAATVFGIGVGYMGHSTVQSLKGA